MYFSYICLLTSSDFTVDRKLKKVTCACTAGKFFLLFYWSLSSQSTIFKGGAHSYKLLHASFYTQQLKTYIYIGKEQTIKLKINVSSGRCEPANLRTALKASQTP